ncbi:MAG: 3-ketoacyl-ACP reductase [Bacteroidales bacterium]
MKKTALITGGSRGIGLGIARELAAQGYSLAINGRREEQEVQNILEELKKKAPGVIYCRGDIASRSDRDRIFNEVMDAYGMINVLVNNAGIPPSERKDLLEMTEESYDMVMDTNLKGPLFLTRTVARHMIGWKNQKSDFQACIINISSISATVASVNRGEYCISKAGMGMMTRLYATRLGEVDIPVFEIRPGVVETDMTFGVKEKYDRLIDGELSIQKRWGKPEDVGKVVSSLVSGNFAYSTGQVIMVDGGITIQRL